MLKKDEPYYSDAMYQLEINLHKVRQELLSMLEFNEQMNCEHCLLQNCKCTKTVKKGTNDSPLNKTDIKGNSNSSQPCAYGSKNQSSPPAAALPKPKWEKANISPAPSRPEKLTINQDIETWIEASKKKKVKAYRENDNCNYKKSLVTIESVRPADLSRPVLQRSGVMNSSRNFNSSSVLKSSPANLLNGSPASNGSNLVTSANHLSGFNLFNSSNIRPAYLNSANMEAFIKYFKQLNHTKEVYTSASLASASKRRN